MGVVANNPKVYDLVASSVQVERIATGFTFTEGPIWHPTAHYLLFSDMPGDVRRKYTPDGTVVEVKNFSNKGNGLTYDADLNLLICEHVTSCLVRQYPSGEREIIAQEFEGEELNSPNDVCVHSSGAIYFSDPWYGRIPVFGHPRKRRLGFQGVYRLAPNHVPGGEPQLLVERYLFTQPNGLCFSPCERLLYVNDTEQANIRMFDVADDGALRNGRIFASGISANTILDAAFTRGCLRAPVPARTRAARARARNAATARPRRGRSANGPARSSRCARRARSRGT